MSTVVVHCLSDDDSMTISFCHEGKQKNMKRSKDEPLEKSLKRITLSLQNVKKKCKKDKKSDSNVATDIPSASLWFNGKEVVHSLPNVAAWKDGAEMKLGERTLKVEVNPPTVVSLTLPGHIMVGFPIFPVVELQFSTMGHCVFKWYRSINTAEDLASASPLLPKEDEWEEVGSSFFYKPSLSDVGCYLKLECTAGTLDKVGNIKTEVFSTVKVAAGPGFCPFENRHLYTSKKLDSGAFRVVSYNILADIYARDEFAISVLYPYCPPYALDIGYRKQLLLKELTGYNADILCLQECGAKIFDNFLERAMEMLGYQGLLKCKAGEIPEGEATFFNKMKFDFISSHDVTLKESLLLDEVNGVILDHVSSIPPFLENITKKNAVAQITLLKDKEQKDCYLCIVNTHLYYKPKSLHVRLVQAAIILNQLQKVINWLMHIQSTDQQSVPDAACEQSISSSNVDKVAVIFCGDLNSNPRSGVVELLGAGHVDGSHRDWTTTDDHDEHCQTLSISHQFSLCSACGFPPYTNYTLGYKGTLDYIFYDDEHLEVEAVIPVPSEEELSLHSAVPSVVMPSDHIALICDLKWKK